METDRENQEGSPWAWFWGMAVFALSLDQGTKWLAESLLDPYRPPTLIPGFFELRLVHNDGAAFSMFRGGRWMFILISVAAAFFLPYYLRSLRRAGENHFLLPVGLGLIWGGAMGNAVDRIFRDRGLVVDFFHFFWGEHSFPVFNVADSAITVGLVAIVWATLFPGTQPDSVSEKDKEEVHAPDPL